MRMTGKLSKPGAQSQSVKRPNPAASTVFTLISPKKVWHQANVKQRRNPHSRSFGAKGASFSLVNAAMETRSSCVRGKIEFLPCNLPALNRT